MNALDGKVAFITGGTRGIGRAIAEAFLAEGASVVVGGRNTEVGEQLCAELDLPNRLSFVPTDVTQQADVEGLVEATVARFGRLDIAVLNAGGVKDPAPLVDMTDEEWIYEQNLNLNHTFWGMRRALRHMLPAGSGRVLVISSVEGKHGKARVAGYVANKHAMNGLTKSVAKEVGPQGITVNAICPGLVLTDMVYERAGKGLGLSGVDELVALYSKETALLRPVTVEEVAATAVFLASDAASGITGALVSVDGGTAAY